MKIVDIKHDDIFGDVYKFEHTNDPITGINGKLFYDFTPYCNFDMERLDEEICIALSDIELTKYPTVPGVIPPAIRDSEPCARLEHEVLYEYDGDKSVLADMTIMQRRKYLFFKKQILVPWFFVLDLKPIVFITRHLDLNPWNDIVTKFPYLKECVEKMPFLEIGRVVIYGSWSDAKVPCHRDDIPSSQFGHHINFNPGGYRPVYLYEPNTNEKFYLPHDYKFYSYNTTDYHGVDAMPHFTYTVRVDGVYNDTIIDT